MKVHSAIKKTKSNQMKQLSLSIAAAAVAMLAVSCGKSGPQGQVVGDYSNKMNYQAPVPLGMVWVPAGVMKSGAGDQDIQNALDAPIRTMNISGFYMDATEITNAEYRQFTNWVRDSIAHTMLGDFRDNDDGTQQVDWKKTINWKDADVQDQLMGMYIPAEQSAWGKKTIDASKLLYTYRFYDRDAHIANAGQPATSFISNKTINVYPDTLVWLRQFQYSNNEPIADQYNWFPAFDEYPVVGVNWNQANAFCTWRTSLWRSYREGNKMYYEGEFKLPTESEWEWAARGGRELSPYPWGGPYTQNQKGCYLANFKPVRGDYSIDGGLYTVRADAYWPNDYGLYNMAGNVAEWTSSAYTNEAYNPNILADMNPDIKRKMNEGDAQWLRRITVKGGSWRDPAYFMNVNVRDYEFADTAKAYIGFRVLYRQANAAITNNPGR